MQQRGQRMQLHQALAQGVLPHRAGEPGALGDQQHPQVGLALMRDPHAVLRADGLAGPVLPNRSTCGCFTLEGCPSRAEMFSALMITKSAPPQRLRGEAASDPCTAL